MEQWPTSARGWLRRHKQGVLDVGLTLGILAFAMVSPWPGANPGLGTVLRLAQTLPLLLRRRAPLGSFAAILAAGPGGAYIWGFDVATSWGTPIALDVGLYSLAAYRPRPISLSVLVGFLLFILIWTLSSPWGIQQTLPDSLLFGGIPATAAWVAGDIVRVRRIRGQALAVQAARDALEREEAARQAMSEERARQAAVAERSRIARELHDVVAHNVSVMVVQAGAARRMLTKDPAEARKSIASIESTGRQALTEMRRLLGVVRKPGRTMELAPQPGLEQIQTLVEKMREAGVEVSLEVEGTARPLPPGLELSAYRVVQEALTNVLKHAQARHATVRLRYGRDELRIAVIDDGRGHVVFEGEPEAGFGLIGLRERVALFGGEFESGNLPPGRRGYQVVATLPLPA